MAFLENVKYPVTDPAIIKKIILSRQHAEGLVKKGIKCPVCGIYLLDVYGNERSITRVKCRKCKFNEIIDTGLFRTTRWYRRNRYY